MDTIIGFITKYTVVDMIALIAVLLVCVKGVDKFINWGAKKLHSYYLHKRGIEKKDETIENLAGKIDKLAGDMSELSTMVKDIGKQCEKLEENIEENKRKSDEVDRDLLRDRILGGMRFFNQNRDEHGNVHISRSDHENLSHLFERYFERNGNGTVKQKYKNEFLQFIIDD